jgi:cell division protein FtsI/penicillin-binding protein 2
MESLRPIRNRPVCPTSADAIGAQDSILPHNIAVVRRFLLCALLIAPLSAADLQRAMDRVMSGRAGTAVALDVDSGRILARYRIDVAARRLARPGSTVKPFALLASGAKARTLVCARKLQIGARQMDCTHPATPDPLDAGAALAYSCNYYFASLAAGLRSSDLVEAFTRAGLISQTGLDAGEAVGEIIAPVTLEQRQLLALGEANIRITPLGLLSAYRKLALQRNRAISEGLEAATEYGTARLARPPGMKVGGKTGTASDPGSGQIHAWFAGYAPAESPRIVVVVFLEQGAGGRDAAPIARELFQAALPAP